MTREPTKPSDSIEHLHGLLEIEFDPLVDPDNTDLFRLLYAANCHDAGLDDLPYDTLEPDLRTVVDALAYESLHAPGLFAFGYVHDEQLVGVGMGRPSQREIPLGAVEYISVDERFRGLSLGGRMLGRVEQRLAEHGSRVLILASSTPEIGFYERHGYEHGLAQLHGDQPLNPMFKVLE